MTPEARAEHAQRLCDDPLLAEAFDTIRATAIDVWAKTKADAVNEREIAWLTVKVLDRVRGELQSVIDNGKIAAARVQNPLR